MSLIFPALRRVSHGTLGCTPYNSALVGTARQWSRSSSGVPFRPTVIARYPPPSSPLPPATPPTPSTPSSTKPVIQSRKPEDLYPESFPLNEKDLVNPSGRIYAVRRPPHEEDAEGNKAKADAEGYGIDPYGRLAVPVSEAKNPPIFRALFFFGASGILFYLVSAEYSVRQTDKLAQRIKDKNSGMFGDFSSFFGSSGNVSERVNASRLDERKIKSARKQELAEKLGRRLKRLLDWCNQLGIPNGGKQFVGRMYTLGAESYLHLPETKEALLPIVAINTAIFLTWRVSMLPSMRHSLEQFMRRYFLHAPASGRTYTMLTSTFSHRGGLHFLFNNVAMWSFGAIALAHPIFYSGGLDKMGLHTTEASLTPHVLAFFVTAGIFSGLVSHLGKAFIFRLVAARKGLAAATFSVGRTGSLGASGAVYAMIVMTAMTFPETKVSLIFLPMIPLSIGSAVTGMVLFDAVGLLFRLRLFDHAAHLGGAAFGLFYYYYGNRIWEECKGQIRAADAEYIKR